MITNILRPHPYFFTLAETLQGISRYQPVAIIIGEIDKYLTMAMKKMNYPAASCEESLD
jgi:hypothetical protein